MIKAVVITPNKECYVAELGDDSDVAMKSIQLIVGGYVELLRPTPKTPKDIFFAVDDEGALKADYKRNDIASSLYRVDICGNAVVIRITPKEIKTLSEKEIGKLLVYFSDNFLAKIIEAPK